MISTASNFCIHKQCCVLSNCSPRLSYKQPKGSIYSNVLTTLMNFSLGAQGNGLPTWWVEKLRLLFDAADPPLPLWANTAFERFISLNLLNTWVILYFRGPIHFSILLTHPTLDPMPEASFGSVVLGNNLRAYFFSSATIGFSESFYSLCGYLRAEEK